MILLSSTSKSLGGRSVSRDGALVGPNDLGFSVSVSFVVAIVGAAISAVASAGVEVTTSPLLLTAEAVAVDLYTIGSVARWVSLGRRESRLTRSALDWIGSSGLCSLLSVS